MRIVVGHLYPDYLNIYADRGNIAVLARRASWRGHELEVRAIGLGDRIEPGACSLYYVGGGQDREQALVAADLAEKGKALAAEVERGAALLAVCGGYQLLGRGYRDAGGRWLEGAGLFPLETVAGERRMIGDVLLECELEPGEPGPWPDSRTMRAARCSIRARSRSAGCWQASATTARAASRAAAWGARSARTSTARSSRATRGSPTGCSARRSAASRSTPLPDELEAEAHDVSAARARKRR